MKDLEHLQEQINQYLSDKMNAEERSVFEELLETDNELRTTVEFQRELFDAIRYQQREETIAKFVTEKKQSRKTNSREKIRIRPLWIAAAAVILVLMAIWLAIPSSKRVDLMANDLLKKELAGEFLAVKGQVEPWESTAQQLLKAERFSELSILLDSVSKENEVNTARFIKFNAISASMAGNHEQSIALLQQTLRGDLHIDDRCNWTWLLVLVYSSANKKEDMQTLASQLLNETDKPNCWDSWKSATLEEKRAFLEEASK